MLPFRQSSLVQQPDGEIMRAVMDSTVVRDEDLGIQFDLGLLGLKVAQEIDSVRDPQTTQLSVPGDWHFSKAYKPSCMLLPLDSGLIVDNVLWQLS